MADKPEVLLLRAPAVSDRKAGSLQAEDAKDGAGHQLLREHEGILGQGGHGPSLWEP